MYKRGIGMQLNPSCNDAENVKPWQVILQTVKTDKNGQTFIEDTIVHTSDLRPTYNDAIQKLVQRSQQI